MSGGGCGPAHPVERVRMETALHECVTGARGEAGVRMNGGMTGRESRGVRRGCTDRYG